MLSTLPRRVLGAALPPVTGADPRCRRCLAFAEQLAEATGRDVDGVYTEVAREAGCPLATEAAP